MSDNRCRVVAVIQERNKMNADTQGLKLMLVKAAHLLLAAENSITSAYETGETAN